MTLVRDRQLEPSGLAGVEHAVAIAIILERKRGEQRLARYQRALDETGEVGAFRRRRDRAAAETAPGERGEQDVVIARARGE